MNFCIARDMGRLIGPDLLHANRAGMLFCHPLHASEYDKVVCVNRRTAEILAGLMGECSVVEAPKTALRA